MVLGRKGGFASLNGLVTVISVETGKCLDHRVSTKKCAQCSSWDNRKDSEEYNEFLITHESDCLINHIGLWHADGSKIRFLISC